MAVVNVHERVLDAPRAEIGKLIDSLASADDRLWPRDRWPAMRFDRPLGVGAVGGHGPIRYSVESYEPGFRIQYRFSQPKGFVGVHRFEAKGLEGERTRLRHVIEMRVQGMARLTWPLAIRPLHDALIEDALDRAQRFAGGQPAQRSWSPWVRFLRWTMGRSRSSQRD